MRTTRFVLIVLVSLFAIPSLVHADGPDDNAPQAVARYLEALLGADFEGATRALCEGDRDDLDRTDFEAALEQFSALDFTIDPSALSFETVRQDTTWAQVRVAGEILIAIDGLDEPVMLPPADLEIDTFWAVYEQGEWKACRHPPPDAFHVLEPDEVAYLFLEASFAGDYETAHALVCETQQGTFSEAQFNASFGQLDLQIDLSHTTFEIGQQTEDEAVVDLTGLITFTSGDRPDRIQIPAAQLGFGPVHLVAEDGWKICQPQVVES